MAALRKAAAVPAVLGPDSSEDEAPEEVTFGAAEEAAKAERKLVGEAARRHRELLKEKRRRRQELFAEQKRQKLLPEAVLQELAATPPARIRNQHRQLLTNKALTGVPLLLGGFSTLWGFKSLYLTRSKRNYIAVCLKDQCLTGLSQQLAKDFVNAQLYGPDANRAQANEFFSLENKRSAVKKAAVQFVDKSWGEYEKPKLVLFGVWLRKKVAAGHW
ncbi:NOL7 protein, partial [Centropus bengalensis]|nr:NOL7 protein [Centropus bengalensis]